jgi:hypothetical protein
MKTKRLSKAEQLIRDHLDALRVERRLKKTLDQLCKKHPCLKAYRPLLLIHTYKDGRKVYGRWTNEYDRVFIPALQPNKKGREEFLEEARAALPAHTKKRIAAGVEAADDRLGNAGCDEVSAFHKIITHAPRTAKEAGLIARHVIKHLPIEAGGTVFGNGRDEYEKWKVRRHYAFFTVETVLRTFAKAAA